MDSVVESEVTLLVEVAEQLFDLGHDLKKCVFLWFFDTKGIIYSYCAGFSETVVNPAKIECGH